MANVIQLKRSSTLDSVPSGLAEGELAVNVNASTVVGNVWLGIAGPAVTKVATDKLNTLAGFAFFLDDDTMAGDSATQVASQQSIVAYTVPKTLFDAHTVLYAVADNTPLALTVGEQTVVGRLTGGNISAVALGIADNNIVQMDSADAGTGEYARFTANGLEGRTAGEVAADLGVDVIGSVTHKFDATAAPNGATDDVTLGYGPGSLWVDVTNDKSYVCLDGTDGVAVWTEITQTGGGVDVNGTPALNQLTVWFDVDTLKSFAGLTFDGSDMTIYELVNDGNPSWSLGKDANDRLLIQAIYDTGAQDIVRVDFKTSTTDVAADSGLFRFSVDDVAILDIDDGGINLASGKAFSINGTDVLTGTNLDNVTVDGGTY